MRPTFTPSTGQLQRAKLRRQRAGRCRRRPRSPRDRGPQSSSGASPSSPVRTLVAPSTTDGLDRATRRLDGRRAPRVHHHARPGSSRHLATLRDRLRDIDLRRPWRPWRAHSRNSTLPAGPAQAATPSPTAARDPRLAASIDHGVEDPLSTRPGRARRRPRPTSIRSGLELRLDQEDAISPVCRRRQRAPGSTVPQRDERQVGDHEPGPKGSASIVQLAHVRPLEHGRPGRR